MNKKEKEVKLPKGFKVVPPPKNAEWRALMEGPDITTSGGCRTRHKFPIHPAANEKQEKPPFEFQKD
jgi:hypothetical protein